jgi:hypothetical protein
VFFFLQRLATQKSGRYQLSVPKRIHWTTPSTSNTNPTAPSSTNAITAIEFCSTVLQDCTLILFCKCAIGPHKPIALWGKNRRRVLHPRRHLLQNQNRHLRQREIRSVRGPIRWITRCISRTRQIAPNSTNVTMERRLNSIVRMVSTLIKNYKFVIGHKMQDVRTSIRLRQRVLHQHLQELQNQQRQKRLNRHRRLLQNQLALQVTPSAHGQTH